MGSHGVEIVVIAAVVAVVAVVGVVGVGPCTLSWPACSAEQGSETFDRFVRVCCRAYNILRRCSHEFITLFSLMLSTGIPELQAAIGGSSTTIAIVGIAMVSTAIVSK